MRREGFAKSLTEWLLRISATEDPPKSVVAYNVGLFETPDGFSAYLAGCDHYAKDNNDWACEVTFTPEEGYFPIAAGTFNGWEEVQAAVVGATREFLRSPAGRETFLAKANAVTVGFDDGNLTRVDGASVKRA